MKIEVASAYERLAVARNVSEKKTESWKAIGRKQAIETLINEEALLFARLLRDESELWSPRIMNALTSL